MAFSSWRHAQICCLNSTRDSIDPARLTWVEFPEGMHMNLWYQGAARHGMGPYWTTWERFLKQFFDATCPSTSSTGSS
eukprot:scaffold2229_cov413-Prasinococcus_capsulatus_cf.AAC.6